MYPYGLAAVLYYPSLMVLHAYNTVYAGDNSSKGMGEGIKLVAVMMLWCPLMQPCSMCNHWSWAFEHWRGSVCKKSEKRATPRVLSLLVGSLIVHVWWWQLTITVSDMHNCLVQLWPQWCKPIGLGEKKGGWWQSYDHSECDLDGSYINRKKWGMANMWLFTLTWIFLLVCIISKNPHKGGILTWANCLKI